MLRGEGKATITTACSGYEVLYTADRGRAGDVRTRRAAAARTRPGAREGVDIVMLTSPTASSEITSPLEVATTGVLLRPLKTFTFG